MQVQSIDIELQMIYSAVDNIMDKLVPINCSNLAAFGTTQINLGKDILNCCVYLRKKIQNNDFEYLVNKLINILVVLGIWSNPEKNIFNNKIKK